MVADRTPSADHERQNSLLTTTQRKRIDSNITNTPENRQTRDRVRKRVRSGIRDFRLLADELEERDRRQIFEIDALPFTEEYLALDKDVAKAIEFLYVGMNGQARFRRPLSVGTSRGEVELGNVEYSAEALPRFVVHGSGHSFNERETVELIRNGDWEALESPDLFSFIRSASQADAIDFDSVEEFIDRFQGHEVREHLLNYGETTELAGEALQKSLELLVLLWEHDVSGDDLARYLERRESAIEDVNRFIEEYEEYEEEFGEYLEHREEFKEWREEQSD